MSIFDLHSRFIEDYRDFVCSHISIADDRARDFVDKHLEKGGHPWPEPSLQLTPSYAAAATVKELAQAGVIAHESAEIFYKEDGKPFCLYRHQEEAIRKALSGASFVVTSGTGSGKSLCYFLPIMDSLIRSPAEGDRVSALVVYPMNALVNSQLQFLIGLKERYERRTGKSFPITFAKYTGDTKGPDRDNIRLHPPQILLTNYVMGELLLVRPEDQRFLDRVGGGLRFLVFDELHTYRGRQGADVAMLVRRLKQRCASPGLVHIGTSATMISRPDASSHERRQSVANFAARFFGTSFTPEQVIEEELTVSKEDQPSDAELSRALETPMPEDAESFRKNPLVIFVEHEMGVEKRADGELMRRKPRPLSEVAKVLAERTGKDLALCEQRLREVLVRGSSLTTGDGGRVLAFKLHQFLSQGRTLYATLESADTREFSLEGQIYAPNENREIEVGEYRNRLFFPLMFCRHCGQDYYHVVKGSDRFLPHTVGPEEEDEDQASGYLMLAPAEGDWTPDQIPENWYDTRGRIKKELRDRVPQEKWVFPDGTISDVQKEGAHKMWWQPEPFGLCLACGEFYRQNASDFARLASLSHGGRSSATTITATSLLRNAELTRDARPKLLTFTDNRQDASLQAGHFNDFVHVAVLRSSLYLALKEAKVLSFDSVAMEVVKASGLQIPDIAKNSRLEPGTEAAKGVFETFTDLTEYRLYEDLRRGWRVVHPNLEQVGLLKVEYRGLDELCNSSEFDEKYPPLARLSPEDRKQVLRPILDLFRRRLAIKARVLEEQFQQQLRRRCDQNLNEYWGLSHPTELRRATHFELRESERSELSGYSLGVRSSVYYFLRWKLGLSTQEYMETLEGLLELLVRHGLLTCEQLRSGNWAYRLDSACLRWCLGDGSAPPPDPMTSRRAEGKGYTQTERTVNRFFQRFYQVDPASLASLEAREHTAQVVTPGEREKREQRFRMDDDSGERSKPERRLPYLVCSPTMELGVDIADLDMVHLRNVPPTPANYAQRCGRAGRQGQPGLVVTYCGALNSHDQYFFQRREEMIAGSVRPPRLDLANEALLRAHIQAVWLSHVRLPLGNSIENVIDIDRDDLPLKEDAARAIDLSIEARAWVKEQVWEILSSDKDILGSNAWYTQQWIEQVIDDAPTHFDRAFDRWRELYRAAKQQLNSARAEEDRARTREEQNRARDKQDEARRQLNLLLQQDVAPEEGDFYPYRYLASEGFLPGYNFPALPVRAWVPHRDGELVTRPRFLAISEFAPQNFLYHEGSQWESVAFQAPPGGIEQRKSRKRFCLTCGAFTDPDLDICNVCGTRFVPDNSRIEQILDMPNVRMRQRARITADEEERMRKGFNIETYFQFAPDSADGPIEADVVSGEEALLRLIYAPATTLLRLNRGWRASKTSGFLIDPDTGDFLNEDKSTRGGSLRIMLAVQATQNMLLIRPLLPKLRERATETTLRYGIKRGLEEAFQLEETELAVERVGTDEHMSIMLYESAEGGAGVLRRLVEDPNAIAEVARYTLEVCHFSTDGKNLKPDCYAACYECLLNFSNQHEALQLNRHAVLKTLLALEKSRTELRHHGRSRGEHLEWLMSLTDPSSDLERRFLDFLARGGYRLPDDAQRRIESPSCIADFFYRPNVCVFCDGTVHDELSVRKRDQQVRDELKMNGFRVVVIRYDADLDEQIGRYPEIFGKSRS